RPARRRLRAARRARSHPPRGGEHRRSRPGCSLALPPWLRGVRKQSCLTNSRDHAPRDARDLLRARTGYRGAQSEPRQPSVWSKRRGSSAGKLSAPSIGSLLALQLTGSIRSLTWRDVCRNHPERFGATAIPASSSKPAVASSVSTVPFSASSEVEYHVDERRRKPPAEN